MKKTILISSLTLLVSISSFGADFMTGKLIKENGSFYIQNSSDKLEIKTTEKVAKSLPSLQAPTYGSQSNGVPYSFEFKGTAHPDHFELLEVPTNIPGDESLSGILERTEQEGVYLIDGKRVKFGHTKVLNGYEFDEYSQDFFVGKNVLAEGDYDQNGVFTVQAITPIGLFSADTPKAPRQDVEKLIKRKGLKHFILKEIGKNKYSQTLEPFRVSLQVKEKKVVPGDKALIITLSGRQGDSFGAVNGHYAAGIAEVKDDMQLRAEVSNAYFRNGKDILSGNTSLTNYYSHLIQGQNNYRPTYTLIVYGIAPEKLKQFRDALEDSHIQFRTVEMSLNPQFNCTTETIDALESVDLKGKYSQIENDIMGGFARAIGMSRMGEVGETIHYALKNDPSRYYPKAAFNSFVKSFFNKKRQKEYGITRIDYVFYKQIPSKRPVGGMSLGKILKVNKYKKLYEKYEVNERTRLTTDELTPLLRKELQKIPYRSFRK